MRRPLMSLAVLGVTLLGVAPALAERGGPPPPKFPAPAEAFRRYQAALVSVARQACSAHCNAKQQSDLAGAITKVEARTLEACRDGTVTSDEAEWVLAPLNELPDDD